MKNRSIRLLLSFALGCLASASLAQEEEAWAQGKEPLETQIAGRPCATRIRLEVQTTDEREDLLRDDPAYRFYPSRMYAGDVRVVGRNRITVGTSYEWWESEQGFESQRYGGLLIFPLKGAWSSRLRYLRISQDGIPDRDNAAVSASGTIGKIFSTTEYQYTMITGSKDAHQIYEYVSWRAHARLRLGGSGSIRHDGDAWDIWSAGAIATLEPVLDWTTVRAEVRMGGGDRVSDYTEIRGMVYQRIRDHLVLRPDFRYYRDEDDRESTAYGIKLIAYLTPALDVQLGYRYYKQNEGGNFDTGTFGLGLLF
jgi:hypothetical protein